MECGIVFHKIIKEKCYICGKVDKKPIEMIMTDGCIAKDVTIVSCRKCACNLIKYVKEKEYDRKTIQ